MTTKLGAGLGLDATVKIEHEAELFDLKMVYDRWRLYNFNMFNNVLFHFTRGVSHPDGRPSNRLVKASLLYDPNGSDTKEIQFDFKIGVASRTEAEQPQQHSVRQTDSRSDRLADF